MSNLESLVRNIPKVELHLHIEGTLEPELAFGLAARNDVKLPYDSVESLRRAYDFHDLQSFLDLYYSCCDVLRTEQDFYDLTWAYLTRVKEDNVVHTEIFFDPQTHTERGIGFDVFFPGMKRALADAESQLGITSEMIMCFLRHLPEEAALETWQQAQSYLSDICGVGLDSGEAGNPPSKFEKVFAKARDAGLKLVAHAGEEGPAEYIVEALDLLKVQRIDHGVRCDESEELVKRLAAERMPLTVCPLSNVKLCVYKTMEQHNLKNLLKRGLCVTVNSDDPAYFGGYMVDNYWACVEALDLSSEDIRQLALNAVEAAFISDERASAIKSAIEQA